MWAYGREAGFDQAYGSWSFGRSGYFVSKDGARWRAARPNERRAQSEGGLASKGGARGSRALRKDWSRKCAHAGPTATGPRGGPGNPPNPLPPSPRAPRGQATSGSRWPAGASWAA